ncbi:DNA polymerase IV [Syntrophobacter fumaroxidans]|uniref:DNA polymerase IV n=1 Tax=Syntrophobacter fumaroxidans (strain DSM 10017 / MPOB) TaxID=335543 RepID=A0LG84_SYNFM|nr:DNA-directed DNA polymerase [Syntrophobacter fumaroxidans MPOB]
MSQREFSSFRAEGVAAGRRRAKEGERQDWSVNVARRIMHVDMDAFYASVEQADRPEFKGKPVIVGGARRGVVSAASYEARRFGVHSAMPVFQAKRLCPGGIFLPVRMGRYKEVSKVVMDILCGISPLVEQISIDEAFVDITGTEALHGSPESLGRRVKSQIRAATRVTCSVGIAPGKFVAKIASDIHKPDGLTIVEDDRVEAFLAPLPVERIPGIGKKTSEALRSLGVRAIGDVLRFPASFWVKRLGAWGVKLHERARGVDPAPVIAYSQAKSCSAEDTFPEDVDDVETLEKWLFVQSEEVGKELRRESFRGRTVTLKVKFADFSSITRSHTLREATDCTQLIFGTASRLLRALKLNRKVRLVGVGVSNLSAMPEQKPVFSDSMLVRQRKLDRAMDRIHERFGHGALRRGRVLGFESPADEEGDP